jgi:hypothetical protein
VKRFTNILLSVILLFSSFAFVLQASTVQAKDESIILHFNTMIGVPKAYTGSTNPIRGIPGGGLPWVVGVAEGKLSASGKLDVKVHGLVFNPNDPDVIARGLANMNTIPAFRAIVSCLSIDAGGNATTVNVTTDPFPATTGLGAGDAHIMAKLNLPQPCIAPIVLITSPTSAWFASTGN